MKYANDKRHLNMCDKNSIRTNEMKIDSVQTK